MLPPHRETRGGRLRGLGARMSVADLAVRAGSADCGPGVTLVVTGTYSGKHVVRQGRLQADVGAADQQVGDQEGMGTDPLVGRRQGVEPSPELVQPPGFHPAGELPADISGIDVAREEEPGFEDGLLSHDLQQAIELHDSRLP